MTGLNVNGLSFRSTYVIPYDQLKNSETTRKIGQETAKYSNDIAGTNE